MIEPGSDLVDDDGLRGYLRRGTGQYHPAALVIGEKAADLLLD